MAYAIKFKESVRKDLKKLGKAEIARIFEKIFEELSVDPTRYPELKNKFKGLRRLRVGDYRVIYVIVNEEVIVLRIGHRRDIYDR